MNLGFVTVRDLPVLIKTPKLFCLNLSLVLLEKGNKSVCVSTLQSSMVKYYHTFLRTEKKKKKGGGVGDLQKNIH